MNKYVGSDFDELQLEREAHRKTWRQLEQVKGLLRDVYAYAPISEKFRIDAALSQQAEQQPEQKQ